MKASWIGKSLDQAAFEQLATELPGTELQSVLLEVMRHRARLRTPHDVLAQYRRDGFVRPAAVDLRTSVAIDGHLLAAADGFDAIELSPIAPLGVCSTLALTDQHRTLGALRATEVVSDPTNVLALECAERLRVAPAGEVHLATCQRVVRAQPVPKLPGYAPHFRLFCLASAARETRDHASAERLLVRHIAAFQAALDRLEQHGYRFGNRRLDVLARPDRAQLADRIAAACEARLPTSRKALEHNYYNGGIRYMAWVTAPNGAELPIGDGGLFDWVAQLTANRKNVYAASGLGAQLVGVLFR